MTSRATKIALLELSREKTGETVSVLRAGAAGATSIAGSQFDLQPSADRMTDGHQEEKQEESEGECEEVGSCCQSVEQRSSFSASSSLAKFGGGGGGSDSVQFGSVRSSAKELSGRIHEPT